MNVWKNASNIQTFSQLSAMLKKFVLFCIMEHNDDIPLLPLVPTRLATLIRFAWWCQYHSVKGGMNSIRNYIGAVCEWNQAQGHPDPREAEKWVYDKFRREAPKHMEVYEGSKAKMALTHGMIESIINQCNEENITDLRDATSYSVLAFAGVRRGHFIPKSNTKTDEKHMIRWKSVAFLPSFADAKYVLLSLETGKVRCAAKKDPVWTAVGECKTHPELCPVRLLKKWFQLTFNGNSEQFVLAESTTAKVINAIPWTRQLRARLMSAASVAGIDPNEFDESNWSGISFRKFSLSSLAGFVPPQILAAHGEHSTVEITNKYYVTQTVAQRAEHTALIAKGFSGGV